MILFLITLLSLVLLSLTKKFIFKGDKKDFGDQVFMWIFSGFLVFFGVPLVLGTVYFLLSVVYYNFWETLYVFLAVLIFTLSYVILFKRQTKLPTSIKNLPKFFTTKKKLKKLITPISTEPVKRSVYELIED